MTALRSEQVVGLHDVPGLPPGITGDLVTRLAGQVVSSTSDTVTTVAVHTAGGYATLPQSTPDDVRSAFAAARAAQPAWASTEPSERVAVIRRFNRLLRKRLDPVMDLLQAETGKARRHALDEAIEPSLTAAYYAAAAPGLLRPKRRQSAFPPATRTVELRQPKGVVGIISPWNYPFALGISDMIPALLAGNAVVFKPDNQTALAPLLGVELLREAGVPADVLQPVLGTGPVVGTAVVDNADYIGFTGSTGTGREVAARAGGRLVGSSLELGGKNPMLVLGDADPDVAAETAIAAAFANSGQVCLCAERLYVHRDIADAFLARFLEKVAALRQELRFDFDADIGSLTSQKQMDTVVRHVSDAVAKGATVLAGGKPRPEAGPFCYEPTVLAGVTDTMECFAEETFGPVVSVYPVRDDDEAVELASRGEYGLNASVLCSDRNRGERVAARLRCGTVNVNDAFAVAYASKDAPMGGMRASGTGRRHGAEGLLKYTEAQNITTQRIRLLPPPAWLPNSLYRRTLPAMLRLLEKRRVRGRH